MDTSIKKVFVHAYACEPSEGSEPGAGWQAVLAALQIAEDVTVFTRANNVPAVRSGLSDLNLSGRVEIVGFDLSPWLQRLKLRLPGGTQLYYLIWQRAAVSRLRSLHASREFNVAIHATFAVDWLPTSLQWITDLPFVWGPVGGSSRTPLSAYRYLGFRGILSEVVRVAATEVLRNSLGKAAARRSSLVLAQNDDVFARFQSVARTVQLPNAAPVVATEIPQELHGRSADELIAVGRLLPWKGLALALEALARPECTHLTLSVYGAGPDERRLRRKADRLGLSKRVHFRGRRPRMEVLAAMATAKALVFPSFHDSSPWTIAEALALGCPVIALDLAGPMTLLRGAGVEPIRHRAPDLISRLAEVMAHPPQPGAPNVWTPEAFSYGIAEVLTMCARSGVRAGC